MNDTDISEVKVKKASPILGILRIVAIVLAVIVFLTTVLTNVMLVYVIFAPDDMPKPFYLMYYNAGETPAAPVAQSGENSSQTGKTPEAPTNTEGTQVKNGSESPTNSSSIMPGQGILLDTGTKIVNLGGDPSQKKYIRTNVVLEFAPTDPIYFATEAPAASGGEGAAPASPRATYITKYKEEINSRLPVVNDIIITLLSNKDFSAVYTSEGKENLRQEIMQAVNSRLSEYHVIYVYFTEFVMQ
jgi:flagellar basal body-associated protein FliL